MGTKLTEELKGGGGYWYMEVWPTPSLGWSRGHQARTNMSNEHQYGWRRTVDLLIFLIFFTEFGPPPPRGLKKTLSWNLKRKRDPQMWFICSLPALFSAFGCNSIPSLVCKTALSTGGGSGRSKFNLPVRSDQTVPYFSDQLLKPHVALCCGRIQNAVANSRPAVV